MKINFSGSKLCDQILKDNIETFFPAIKPVSKKQSNRTKEMKSLYDIMTSENL